MKATIIYGVSASGKSTRAQNLLNRPDDYSWWIERDKIREYVYPNFSELGWRGGFHPHLENIVTYEWHIEISKVVERKEDLIISDTLCKIQDRRNLKNLLEYLGYEIEWIRMDTLLDLCIERDKKRGIWSVGEDVIQRQWFNLMKHEEHV